MSTPFDPSIHTKLSGSQTPSLQSISNRLNQKLERDSLVQETTDKLQKTLKVDRVVLYYFYTEWKGRVTFESLSHLKWSIFGSTGPDMCFNNEYAQLYLAGRVKAIADVETEPIEACHRDFLRYLHVKANLVVPIVTSNELWGLLIAHQCRNSRQWSDEEIKQMQSAALTLACAPSIKKD